MSLILSSFAPVPAFSAEPGTTESEKGGTDEAQLERSKQLFQEGQAAMDRKEYTLAQAKFSEAYRLAPHLHLFNYNIAVAAQLAGDCRDAQIHFQKFLDLVPEHPERRSASKRLEKLKSDCPIDLESESIISSEGQAELGEQRTIKRAISALNTALAEMMRAEDFYRTVNKEKFSNFAFKWARLRKTLHIRRLKKLFESHRVRDENREIDPFLVPENLEAACKTARSQEGRISRALEDALQYFQTKEAQRVLNRLLRGSFRDGDKFDDCAR